MRKLARAEAHDDVDSVVDAGVVVVFNEGGNHLTFNDELGCRVGDIFLHAVAWTDVHLALFVFGVWLDEDDCAVVFAFLAHSPAVSDFGGVLLYAVALQVVDE